MKAILRNLMSVVRRFKLAASLNILGLSVAFAAFLVIMIQLDYDYGFDKFHKDSDKIFRMESIMPMGAAAIVSRPIAEAFFESSPYIVAGAITNPLSSMFGGDDVNFQIEIDGKRNSFKEKILTATSGFTDVFTFDFAEGAPNALQTPDNVIIPLSLSRKLFGKESAIGQQLFRPSGNLTVGAVYRDFPTNSSVENIIYSKIPDDESKQEWGNFSYAAYIRVNQASNAEMLLENFAQNFNIRETLPAEMLPFWDQMGVSFRLTPLSEIHFLADVQYDATPKTSRRMVMILMAIALVIVTIAAINFTNFSTALTPMRIKSINTQRVLGARRGTLRRALLFEAVFTGFLSYLVALLLVSLFHGSPLAKLVDADLSLAAHPLIIGGMALVALLTGLLAGMYPSRYMTSFAPALVLKGNFALSPKGRRLRNSLIGIQYVASFTLIIGASFMYLQNRFMQTSSLGFDKDALITVNIAPIRDSRDAFTNRLKNFSGIDDVTYGYSVLSGSDNYMKWGRMYKGELLSFQVLPVHHSFLEVMGITLGEGRDFRQEDANSESSVWIFNETARKQYNLELNTSFDNGSGGGEIIGFMPDIKIASFRTAVEPMAFAVFGTQTQMQTNIAYIRLNAGTNLRSAMSHINSTLAEFDANYIFEVRFYDEILQRLYEKETALSSLISLFSMIAIFISIVGVFGLVVFDSECRRKEIGIRKVLGASTWGIILMFNKAYFKILMICFVVAAPLAWYAISRWLQNFAYKTPMYWWVYALAFLAIGIITVATVTFQNWRVASDDPVKAIKSE